MMRAATLIMVLAMAGAASAAEAPKQFDLICKGTTKSGGGEPSPWNARIRVDLTANQYCGAIAACTAPLPIDRVDPNAINFVEVKTRDETNLMWVDRATGKFTRGVVNMRFGLSSSTEASCELAPFTPFPATKF